MPRTKKKAKSDVKKPTSQKQTQKQTVHVHIEQKKSVKRRGKSRPKAESSNPFMSSGSINRGISQNLGNLGRGQVMNEPQMPTILQNIQPVVDPKIEKLLKRSQKVKEYIKEHGGTSKKPIDITKLSTMSELSPEQRQQYNRPEGVYDIIYNPTPSSVSVTSIPSTKPKAPIRTLLSRIRHPFVKT